MGFFKKLFLGGAAAKTYQNVYNRPIVIAPPGYVIMGMRQRGVGSTWVITYSKVGQSSTDEFSVSGGQIDANAGCTPGGGRWTVHFPK